ncbi:hypothetical protein CsatB_009893 [Cannabis sativa]
MSPDMRQHGIGGLSMQCKGNEQYAIHNHLFAMEWKAIQVTYQHQSEVVFPCDEIVLFERELVTVTKAMLQFLQSKLGLCLMPVALASAIHSPKKDK